MPTDPLLSVCAQAPLITTTHTSTRRALQSELSGGSEAFKKRALGGALSGIFAGFGNREKDARAYLSAGASADRVFLINPASTIQSYTRAQGEQADGVQLLTPMRWASYDGMRAALDDLFPAQPARA